MPTFQYMLPTQEEIDTMQVYRDKYSALFDEISTIPHSRWLSLAKTHLEESAMWLNKAITKND